MSKIPFTFVASKKPWGFSPGMLVLPRLALRSAGLRSDYMFVATEASSVKNDESRDNKLVYVNFVGVGLVLRVIGEQVEPFLPDEELTVLNGDGIAVRIQSYLLEEYHV